MRWACVCPTPAGGFSSRFHAAAATGDACTAWRTGVFGATILALSLSSTQLRHAQCSAALSWPPARQQSPSRSPRLQRQPSRLLAGDATLVTAGSSQPCPPLGLLGQQEGRWRSLAPAQQWFVRSVPSWCKALTRNG